MSEVSPPDHSENICYKLTALAGADPQQFKTGDPVDDRNRLRQNDAFRHSTVDWKGPVAFAKAYGGVASIDHDLGTRWGPNCDQRVSLRVDVGSDTGLLYVYDPTWDEYAVIGSDVPLAAVEDAFARAARLGEHPPVADFVTLLPNVHADRRSPGREL